MSLAVTAIPALSDNYIWLLQGDDGIVAIVDPGEAAPAINAVQQAGGRLDWILLTHHHGDHTDGVAAVKAAFPGVKVAGAAADAHRLPPLDVALKPGERFTMGSHGAEIIDTPGHTVGHIAFHFPGVLLSGDTLFSLGCGRLFEGTPADMYHSLTKLGALPLDTLVCCGHEYTESNARFAVTVEPENEALAARAVEVKAQRAAGKPTVPTTIAQELAENPFLRTGGVERLAEIRAAKDNFRG